MLANLCRGDFRKTLLRATEDLAFVPLFGSEKAPWVVPRVDGSTAIKRHITLW
jgi:hypothetical protein